MVAAEETVLILLAAGRSRRFGTADKLAAPLRGRPVGLHIVAALAELPFARRLVVRGGSTLDVGPDYRVVDNPHPEHGLSGSLRLGIAAVRGAGAGAVLIALADMPHVTAAHVRRLLAAADGADAVVASSDGTRPMPPAVFGFARFDALAALEGDEGARDLIRAGRHIVADPAILVDIDTPADLAALTRDVTRSDAPSR